MIDYYPQAPPAHVARFGPQVKAKGINPNSKDVDRTIGYITKYVTKATSDYYKITSGAQPKDATGKLRPGFCKGRVENVSAIRDSGGNERSSESHDHF